MLLWTSIRGLPVSISRASFRAYAVASPQDVDNLRSRLMSEIKVAMKNKDSFASTTLRSVLSEVYSADKKAGTTVGPSAILGIIRKAVQRRVEAAAKFEECSRAELSDKEKQEALLLSKFLPPLLTETEIDRHLNAIVSNLPLGSDPRKSLGVVFKEFYSKVDKSAVDSELAKRRAEAILAAKREQSST